MYLFQFQAHFCAICRLRLLTMYRSESLFSRHHFRMAWSFGLEAVGISFYQWYIITYFSHSSIFVFWIISNALYSCTVLFYNYISVGKSSNHAVVMAMLRLNGQNYGMQAFIVPLRRLDNHEPLPGKICLFYAQEYTRATSPVIWCITQHTTWKLTLQYDIIVH